VLSIYDNERGQPTTNRIDNNIFFVRQLYADFLNRVPAHLEDVYWFSQINNCGADDQCIHNRRVGVADAFFFEPEFQQTGAYIYRIYKAGLGVRPAYAQFISDRGQVVVGARLDQSKTFLPSPLFGATASLRRDPDGGGYDFWLAQVNKFPLRDVSIQQAMACSFITSAEYQTRFSPIVTHTNRECPQ
jgi:hypothetical protein